MGKESIGGEVRVRTSKILRETMKPGKVLERSKKIEGSFVFRDIPELTYQQSWGDKLSIPDRLDPLPYFHAAGGLKAPRTLLSWTRRSVPTASVPRTR